MVGAEIELVPKHEHERLAHVRLQHVQHRAEPVVDARVLHVAQGDAELAPVTEPLADEVGEMPHHDDDLVQPERVAQELDVAHEERLSRDLEHHLRHPHAARMDAPPSAGGGDDPDPRTCHGRPDTRRGPG